MENRFRIDPKQPKVATTTLRREKTAAQMRTERTNKRQDRFNTHRPVIQVCEPEKDSRALRLEIWKTEREKKNAFKQRKPFVVSVVRHHVGSPYVKRVPFTKKVEPLPKTQRPKVLADVKVVSPVKEPTVTGRVTRAMSKAQKQKQPDVIKKPKDINQFAPSDFKFKAPKGISALPLQNNTEFKEVPHVFPVSRTPREDGDKSSTPLISIKEETEKQSSKKMASTPLSSRKLPPNKEAVTPAKRQLSNVTPHQKKSDVSVYREELDKVVQQLESLCTEWSSFGDKINIPSEAVDSINVAVGQTKLLIREKIAQYRGLIDSCETHTGPGLVTESDLKGFWDMVDLQVCDVISKFEKLAVLRENNWTESKSQRNTLPKKKKKSAPKPKQKPAKSSVRDHIAALRRAIVGLQDSDYQVPEVLIPQHVKTPLRGLQVTPSHMKENVRHMSPVVALVRMQASEGLEKSRRRSSVMMRVTSQMKELSTPNQLSQLEPNTAERSPQSSRKSGNTNEKTGQKEKQRKNSISKSSKQDMFSSSVILKDCAAMVQNTPHKKSVFKNNFNENYDDPMISSPVSNKSAVFNETGSHLTPPSKTYSKTPRKELGVSDLDKQFNELKGTPTFKHSSPKRTPRLRSSHRL